ncbi:solute carrier family 46 member 2 [Eurosta solidaginis]|uniref:solute carrier family 46 member 2 n=1 Tax=Eurosta solidaginis TaxID=178769 RepID=UPI0035308D88
MSRENGIYGDTMPEADAETKGVLVYLQKLWAYRKYLVIEPFFFFYLMASIFNAVAMQNFPLEKACRVNLGYNKIICDTTLDKSELGIDCDAFNFDNTTFGATAEDAALAISSVGFNYTVCKAEVEAQKLAADVSGKRAPIAAIFPLIVLLFAGGWSDRYNKRKPCMIMPIIGEFLSFTCLLISAIFFDSLPMEFGAYCEAIVPALFGGLTFCLMAVYSYITIATPEEDRIFRFGIFAMFITAVPFIGQPISGILFQQLGYVLSFGMAASFQIIAILYIIFFIEEVKPAPKSDAKVVADAPPPLPTHGPPSLSAGSENLAYEQTSIDEVDRAKNVSFELSSQLNATNKAAQHSPNIEPARRSFFREFFDPTLVVDCLKFPLIKRPNHGRMLLILLIIAYFLTLGPATGENDYWYRYTLIKLNWNGNDFSFFFTFSSAAALIGTFIGTAILSKWLKFADSSIGILSALAIVVSRILFAFAKDTKSFYAAGVVDMFVSLRVIAIKTIGSSIVDGEELSKMYSIFGISEPIGQFIFPPIFSVIYQDTVDSFPGAIFLFGEIFYVPNVIVFVLCYIILRRNKNKTKKASQGTTNGNAAPDSEITSL